MALFAGNAVTRHDRIEVVAPVSEPKLKRYLRDVLLETYLSDNTKARELQPNGRYAPIDQGAEAFNAQTYFVGKPGIE